MSAILHEPINANSTEALLPSYSMYKSIIHKKLNGLNRLDELPNYQAANQLTSSQSQQSLDTTSIRTKDLDSLTKSTNCNIKLLIELTEEASEIGKKSKIITEEGREYKQNDYIYGYAIIENISDQIIPFSVFYIILEGIYQYDDKFTHKVLSMIDLNASLINTEIPKDKFDESDNTCILMDDKLQPHIKYKRFFTFKVPHYILDSTCKHYLSNHLSIPPSFGGFGKYRDFGLAHSWMKYCIKGYLIGEDSKEFRNLSSIERELRIIARYANSHFATEVNNYRFFHNRLKQELQVYNKKKFQKLVNDLYESKESAFEPLRGEINMSQSKTVYVEIPPGPYKIKYVPPNFSHPDLDQTLEIPIKFMQCPRSFKIKEVRCELVIATVGSTNNSIPFTIESPMIFSNKNNKLRFQDILSKPYKKLYQEVAHTMKNGEIAPMEYLRDSLQKLSHLHCNYTELAFENTKHELTKDPSPTPHKYSNPVSVKDKTRSNYELNLKINLKSMHIKRLDKAVKLNRFGGFTLIPNFQTCYLARFYFLNVVIVLGSKQRFETNVPILIE